MTHDEMIAVIQAHKEGKTIEVLHYEDSGWVVAGNPVWDFSSYDYRVKKEPKKIYIPVWIGRGFSSSCYETKEAADRYVKTYLGNGWKVATFVEVTE